MEVSLLPFWPQPQKAKDIESDPAELVGSAWGPNPFGSFQRAAQSSLRVPCVSLLPQRGSLEHLRKLPPTIVTVAEQEQSTGCCRAWLSGAERTGPQGGAGGKVSPVNPRSCPPVQPGPATGVLGIPCWMVPCRGDAL